MPEDNLKSMLSGYLATGELPPLQPTTTIIVSTNEEEVSPIFRLMALLCAIGMVAKDLHYRARSRSFYGIHLLADLVWDVKRYNDEINEVYYMGECMQLPPLVSTVCKQAVEYYNQTIISSVDSDEQRLLNQIQSLEADAEMSIEESKKIAKRAGTQAVLDEVGKKLLAIKALITRTSLPQEEN